MKKILTALFVLICFTGWAQQNDSLTQFMKINVGAAEAKSLNLRIDSINRFLETHTVQIKFGKWNSGTTKSPDGQCENPWQARVLRFYAKPIDTVVQERIVERVVIPKGGDEMPPITIQDNHFTTTAAAPIQQPCCRDKRGENEYAAYGFLRSVKGNILLPQGTEAGFGIHMVTHRLYKNDDESIYARPTGWKSLGELYMQASRESSNVPCDTCGNWNPLIKNNGGQPAIALATGPVILGWKPFSEVGWLSVRASFMFRYDTPLGKNKNAGWAGFSLAPEIELLVGSPTKTHLEVSASERWHPFPTAPATFGPGAFNTALNARVVIPFGQKTSAERQSEKLAKRQERDSLKTIQRQEKFIRDSIAVDSFFLSNPQPIIIDTVGLAPDTTIRAMRLPMAQAPVPFTKGAKSVRIENAKAQVLELQNEHNQLRSEIQAGDRTKWGKLQKNIRQLKKAEKNLKQKKARANK